MTRVRLAAVAVSLLASAAAAHAQVPGPVVPTRPTFSPYLNLLRGGGSPALNYYGLVRPQQQFAQQQNQLNQQLQQTNRALQAVNDAVVAGGDPDTPGTGHAAVFNNTLHYFGGQPGSSGARPGSYLSSGRSFTRPMSGATPTSAGAAMASPFGGTAGNGYRRR